MQSKRVRVGKLGVHYFTGGQGDPLVLIHGGGEGSRAWLQNLEDLCNHYTVYLPDLPGFGYSQPMGEDFSIPEFVEFVKGFSSNLGLERPYLVGHSIGGGVALHYALRFPQEIKKLVLVSSMYLNQDIALWVRFLSSPVLRLSLGEAAFFILKSMDRLSRAAYFPFKFVNPLSRTRMDLGRDITMRGGQTAAVRDRLHELVMPTLLVWGANDPILPVSHAYEAASLIPDCQLHIFEGCGHTVYKQRVSEFSQLLIQFLS